MLEVVDLFAERGTRDELGMGGIRDAFADMLFPGTTTIMTRARYFLLVPWTYLELERKRKGSKEIAQFARRAEAELIEVIERSEDSAGNIGKHSRHALKRMPSSVYWQGLGVWGIRTYSGSQDQYHRSVDRFYSQIGSHSRRQLERDLEHDDLAGTNWLPAVARLMPEDFQERSSLRLRRQEAEFLRERIRLSPRTSGTMLDELATRRDHHEPVAFAWEHPMLGAWPPRLQAILGHAQNFSDLMHGASLLYNLILAEESAREEAVNQFRDRLEDWAQRVVARAATMGRWDRARFWELAMGTSHGITTGARVFVEEWWELVLGGGPSLVCDSKPARALVTKRERELKRGLARIGNPRARELWNGDSGSDALEFRWGITQALLNDIFDGLEAADA